KSNAQSADSGSYRVVTWNNIGSSELTFYVAVTTTSAPTPTPAPTPPGSGTPTPTPPGPTATPTPTPITIVKPTITQNPEPLRLNVIAYCERRHEVRYRTHQPVTINTHTGAYTYNVNATGSPGPYYQ